MRRRGTYQRAGGGWERLRHNEFRSHGQTSAQDCYTHHVDQHLCRWAAQVARDVVEEQEGDQRTEMEEEVLQPPDVDFFARDLFPLMFSEDRDELDSDLVSLVQVAGAVLEKSSKPNVYLCTHPVSVCIVLASFLLRSQNTVANFFLHLGSVPNYGASGTAREHVPGANLRSMGRLSTLGLSFLGLVRDILALGLAGDDLYPNHPTKFRMSFDEFAVQESFKAIFLTQKMRTDIFAKTDFERESLELTKEIGLPSLRQAVEKSEGANNIEEDLFTEEYWRARWPPTALAVAA